MKEAIEPRSIAAEWGKPWQEVNEPEFQQLELDMVIDLLEGL